MRKIEIFCVTNLEVGFLEKLGLNLAGVGKKKFPKKYITCLSGKSIQKKEKNYSELTFHYWFWKNKLSKYQSNTWIGFCQKRRFWLKKNTKVSSIRSLKKNVLLKVPKKWKFFDSIICKPIFVHNPKKIKILKRGWRSLITKQSIFFNKNKENIALHFDMHHGYGNLDLAINVLDNSDKNDFKKFVYNNNSFNPHIMFITKPEIMDKWFNQLFSWLKRCEEEYRFKKLTGYDTTRLYAYLAERYLSFWFKKYTKYLENPWIFLDY